MKEERQKDNLNKNVGEIAGILIMKIILDRKTTDKAWLTKLYVSLQFPQRSAFSANRPFNQFRSKLYTYIYLR